MVYPNKSKMAAATIFNFRKISITPDWIFIQSGVIELYQHQISCEDASRPCRDDHVTKSRNRKLIRVTSSTKGLKHMCVDLSDYNRYLNQIWYRTQIPHYQHAGWPNWQKLKIQDGGGRHLEFRKIVNNFGLDKDILDQIIWEDASRPCGDDRVTKSRNRKLIRVTSSTKGLKHMCVDLGDYNRYFNQIWYITQIPH